MVWIVYTANPSYDSHSLSTTTVQQHNGQVKSGNVYVAPDDSVENVKSTILSASATQGKKSSKKSSKHALAIGTSFGHVHAFLKDSDSLLQEIEKNRAQDKCLMLIKKPKSSSKQMLKAQSWANLSVSDSHLYQQLDGGYHTDHRRHPKYRTKRKQSDLQLLAETEAGFRPLSNETSRSESLSDKQRFREDEVRRKIKNEERFQKTDNKVSESKREYPYLRKDQENMYPQTQRNWTSKQTSSNQCLSEINNNQKLSNGNRMYSSHNDIYMQFPQSSTSYKSSKHIKAGAIKSDEFYSNNICDIQEENVDQDPVSRSQSVGDLTTGLTLSLVGQRKSESIQCLSAAHAPPKPPRLFQNSVKTYSPVPQKYSNNRNTQRPHSDLTNQNSSPSNGNTKSQKQRKSLVNLNTLSENHVLIEDDSLSEFSVRSEQGPSKTPNKQRRTLPCIPSGDLNEKKRQYAEIVKMRMSAQSRSSVSSSRQSQFTPQSADISRSTRTDETLSDREVSDLFVSPKGNGNNSLDVHDSAGMCNKKGYDSNIQDKNMNKVPSGFYSANQGNVITSLPSSVRSCDSGQTTLTSLSSTVDSGYMTNDQDVDMYSSSSYTRSLQKSAQNLYHNNKLQVYSYGNSSRQDSQSDKPIHTTVNNRRQSMGDNYKNNSKRNERHSTGTYNYDEIHPHYSKTSYMSKENVNNINSMPNRSSASKIKENPTVQNVTSPTIIKNGNRIVNGATSGNGAKKPVATVFRRISDLELSSNWDHGNGQKSNFYQGQGHYEEEVTDFTSKVVKDQTLNESNVIPVHDKHLHQGKKVVNKNYLRNESPDDSVISEELQYSTLPGNWRYHGNKNKESVTTVKKSPCLYQILQTHDLIPIRISLDETCLFVDIAKLQESQISLPLVKRNVKQDSPVVSTPKGKYANLGGPGSAFKPVKTVSANISLVTMVTFDEILKTNVNSSNLEELQKGDILVEVNEQLVMGEKLSAVQEQLQKVQGEILLTIARLKPTQNTTQNNDKNQSLTVEELKKEMELLQAEVKLKDQKIQELNSLLPWKHNVEEVVKKIEINGNCYPRELLPSGLGEDEYIV